MKKIKYKIASNYLIFVLLTILLCIAPDKSGQIDKSLLGLYSSIMIFSLLLHFFINKNIENWFRIDILFLLGFFIVHFQWAVMYSFSDIVPYGISRVWAEHEYVNYGTWISAVSGLAWIFGFNLFNFNINKNKNEVLININKLYFFAIIIFTLFLVFAGGQFLNGAVYKGTSESNSLNGIAGYLQLLSGVSIMVLIYASFINAKIKTSNNNLFHSMDMRIIAFVFIYISTYLYSGDRGGAIQLAIITLTLYSYLINPIKLKRFLLIVIFGAFILTLIGLGRGSQDENVLLAGADNANINSGYDLTLELANSARTLYKALAFVPEREGYFLGQLWITKLLSPIPYAQSLFIQLTGMPVHELGSAGYITYITFGENPTTGEGTSFVADIYLNFGLIGVLFFSSVFGVFIKKIHVELLNNRSRLWGLVAVLVASEAVYFGRGSMFGFIRTAVWGGALFILLANTRNKK